MLLEFGLLGDLWGHWRHVDRALLGTVSLLLLFREGERENFRRRRLRGDGLRLVLGLVSLARIEETRQDFLRGLLLGDVAAKVVLDLTSLGVALETCRPVEAVCVVFLRGLQGR